MPLTLLIPELVWSNPDEPDAFAPLAGCRSARLLARLSPSRTARGASETILAAEAGWPADPTAPPAPLAALRLAGEAAPGAPAAGDDFWLCADPVHLRFHQDRLILGDASRLDLAPEEVAALAADLGRALAPASLHAPHPGRWYLRLPDGEAADAGSPPPSEVTGRAIHPAQLGTSRRCRQLANEIQILLHDHPVNAARAARGAATVNALWLWGGGRLSAPRPAVIRVVGDGALARGLAFAGGHPPRSAEDFTALPARAAPPVLAVLDDLLAPSHYQEADAYSEAWRAIDRHWLAPALAALQRGQLDLLRIVAPTTYGTLRWQLRPRDLWRAALTPSWLQPSAAKNLAALAQQLASTPTR